MDVLLYVITYAIPKTWWNLLWPANAIEKSLDFSTLLMVNIMQYVMASSSFPHGFRKGIEQAAEAGKKNALLLNCIFKEVDSEKVKGFWIAAKEDQALLDTPQSATTVVFYVHGGGNCVGNAYFGVDYLAAVIIEYKKKNPTKSLIMFSVEYPLAPENKYLAIKSSIRAAYDFIAKDLKIKTLYVMGDSAGANGCAILLNSLKAEGLPMPRGAIFNSPWLEVDPGEFNKDKDTVIFDYFPTTMSKTMGDAFADGLKLTDPRISPLHQPVNEIGIPEKGFLISYSKCEVFAPSIGAFIEKVKKNAVVLSEPNMPHDYMINFVSKGGLGKQAADRAVAKSVEYLS